MTDWEKLIVRYLPPSPEKRICNCRQAYATLLPPETSRAYCGGKPIAAFICLYGCSANQISARSHVATCVVKEFKL